MSFRIVDILGLVRRIGIYPGTFDPIHMGHLAFALEAIKVCGLDRVIFFPEATPRGKTNVSSIDTRLNQIQLMIKQYQEFDTKILTSPQFTVKNTLPEIQNEFPNAVLTLLIGSDIIPGLGKWSNVKTLLKTCDIAIGMRSNQTEYEIDQHIAELTSLSTSTLFTIVKTNYSTLASSTFRNK